MSTATGKKHSFSENMQAENKLKNADAKITCFGKFKYFVCVYLQGVGTKPDFYFILNILEELPKQNTKRPNASVYQAEKKTHSTLVEEKYLLPII